MTVQQQRGFTLIEVMIVVTIIAIIGAFAYPNYVEQVRKSRRADAKIGLQEIVQRQESYFTRNYSYAHNLTTLQYATNTINSSEALYSLAVASATPSGCNGTRGNACTAYTISAAPKSTGTQAKDTQCSTFTLDHLGRKSAADNTASSTTEYCW